MLTEQEQGMSLREMAKREAALVEELAHAVESNSLISAFADVRRGVANMIRTFKPDTAATLERIRSEARLEEAKWWVRMVEHGPYCGANDPSGATYCDRCLGEKRIAELERETT